MTLTAQIVLPDKRCADVLSIEFHVQPGVFKVQAQIYIPGSDGKTRGMVGAYRVRTGSGRNLDAAMMDCASLLIQEKIT